VTADNRVLALRFAIDAMAVDGNLSAAQAGDVTATAAVFYSWLEGPAVMVLSPARLTYQQASPDGPGTPTVMKGSAVQLTDTQQVTLSVAEVDSKGQPVTGDALAWSVDNPAVVAITPSADTYSCACAAGTDGTATVTVADNSVTPPLTATDVITVVSSAVTGLVISEGTAEDQPPATPPAA
jgi:hypothetical protein